MWTADLKSKRLANGVASFTVEYTDGKEVIERTYQTATGDGDFLKQQAIREVAELERLDAYVAKLAPGPIETVVAPPEPPTQDELDRTAFFDFLYKLDALRVSVEKGLTKADDVELLNLEAAVKLTFKPEYTNDPRWR